jgi:mRNA degradation ribonuclease J1/J2
MLSEAERSYALKIHQEMQQLFAHARELQEASTIFLG